MMLLAPWRVQIFKGLPVELTDGIPMQFGSPQVTLSHDGSTSEPGVDLVYEPVGLRLDEGSAWLYVMNDDGSSRNFRWMDHVSSVQIDWFGALMIRGMEARPDGLLVTAVWLAWPCRYG